MSLGRQARKTSRRTSGEKHVRNTCARYANSPPSCGNPYNSCKARLKRMKARKIACAGKRGSCGLMPEQLECGRAKNIEMLHFTNQGLLRQEVRQKAGQEVMELFADGALCRGTLAACRFGSQRAVHVMFSGQKFQSHPSSCRESSLTGFMVTSALMMRCTD